MVVPRSEYGQLNPCQLGASFKTRCEEWDPHHTREYDSLCFHIIHSTLTNEAFRPTGVVKRKKAKCLSTYEKNRVAIPTCIRNNRYYPWIQKCQGPFILEVIMA